MAVVVFSQFTLGAPLNGTTLNSDVQLIEDSFSDLGPWIISGLVQSAGTGLTANVTAGVASIGGRVTKSAGWTIVGLADATINHLYLKNDGTGTSNTSGTQPAGSVKLGTATTAGGVVTSVNVLRSSGRQTLVRHESQVAGDVGSMGSIDLGDWNATAGDGWQVFGTLPSSALPAGGALSAQTTKTANYTATSTDYFIFCDATSGNITITLPTAVGLAGKVYVIKKIDASANTVTIDGAGSETLDGATTIVIGVQYTSYSIVSNNANWWVW
jgi:hypothetical protein